MNESQIMIILVAYFLVVFLVGFLKISWDRLFGTPVVPSPHPPAQYPPYPESTTTREKVPSVR